ncbi:MAG TPA: matrixin family metalloprotease [Polyangiaceae bacterium]|nr:matrixin family metalloprotease [Polyangiaceae bacterium]
MKAEQASPFRLRASALGVRALGLGALLALGVAGTEGTARAEYCRTKACDNHVGYDDVWQEEPDPTCTADLQGCRLEGSPLYWPYSCLSFSVQQDGSPKQGIDYDTVHSLVRQAFDTWMAADCGGGATPALRVDDLSPAVCDQAEYNSDQGNANVFMFRDESWPHQNSVDTLALTTITYNRENAQIFDADVEINSYQGDFTTTDDANGAKDDLLSVLTHETGHFLGLSHDSDSEATMYAFYSREFPFQQRDLAQDDIDGMCNIYPPDQAVSTNECVPRHGFLRTCSVEQTKSGCSVASGGSASSAAFVALLGIGLGLRRRRLRA